MNRASAREIDLQEVQLRFPAAEADFFYTFTLKSNHDFYKFGQGNVLLYIKEGRTPFRNKTRLGQQALRSRTTVQHCTSGSTVGALVGIGLSLLQNKARYSKQIGIPGIIYRTQPSHHILYVRTGTALVVRNYRTDRGQHTKIVSARTASYSDPCYAGVLL